MANTKKISRAFAYVLLVFLIILLAVDILITFPYKSPIDLGMGDGTQLLARTKEWYTLRSENFSVNEDLGTISIGHSFIPFLSTKYTYYSVSVFPDDGDKYTMAIRVKEDKRDAIFVGKSVTLYGMISDVGGELGNRLKGSADPQATLYSCCLNDNGDSIFMRCVVAALYALGEVLCIYLFFSIAAKSIKQKRKGA